MFQPVIPTTGLAGLRFLQNTYDKQYDAFVNSATLQRDTSYFREKIADVKTADDLVSDRRLMEVALGAFGLGEDINNKFFIKKMLEEGTRNEDALANKFVDKRYKDLSKAFGLGPGEFTRTGLSKFADEIISKFERQSFEIAVGEQDQSMRIALTAERSLAKLAEEGGAQRQNWFSVMGDPPMRELFQTAFGLPQAFTQVDIDQQQSVFAERSEALFGVSDPAQFAEPALQERLISRFAALSQIQAFSAGNSSAAIALTLLGS